MFTLVMEWVSKGIEAVGVGVIVAGVAITTISFIRRSLKDRTAENLYQSYRTNMGKAILLGLELLVAADIVGTVTVHPSLSNLAVLGLLVLIRTFLSFALEVEITGRWPWQGKK